MNARCTGCNARIDFKASRGAKLKDRRCACGQRYEPMYFVRRERLSGGDVELYRNYNNFLYRYDQAAERFYPQPIVPTATSL